MSPLSIFINHQVARDLVKLSEVLLRAELAAARAEAADNSEADPKAPVPSTAQPL